MIGRRAAPGPRLSTGRIRVDAARAIAKLRDYQLVDRETWILEGVRAAAASGARRIMIRGDANDVWLAWDGEPWPTATLPALFDELVSPEPARESQHLRLLATAVNTALGLPTSHVDVVAIAADGTAHRVRYRPDVLAAVAPDDAAEDTPLRQLDVEAVARPEHAPAPGMLVHLRRRIGFDVLFNLWQGAPPEVGVAWRACADAGVPVEVLDRELGRDRHERDLLREPLGDGLDGFVAIVDPAWPHPDPSERAARLEVAEHGVALAAYPFALDAFGDAPLAPVPIRVFIDAPRMPTNASRSEVRREAHPIAAAEQRARAVLPKLIERLADELRAATPAGPAVTLAAGDAAPARYRSLRDAALALLAARIAGADWATAAAALPAPLDVLAALPLLSNAIGVAHPVRASWMRGVVHEGDPYPAELEPWLGGVLMLGDAGDPARRLLGGLSVDAKQVRRTARRGRKALRAKAKFLRHTPREAKSRPRGTPIATLALGPAMAGTCGMRSLFAGLSGEVSLLPGDGHSELVLLHHDRELETVGVPSPFRFHAVIACDEIRAQASYRYAVRDETFDRVVDAARAAAVRCAEAIALARAGVEAPGASVQPWVDDPGVAAILRRALAVGGGLGLRSGDTPLVRAPIWPTVDGRWLSLVEVDTCGAIGVMTPGAQVQLPGGRTVLALDVADRSWLAGRAGGAARVVCYFAGPRTAIDPAAAYARWLANDHRSLGLAIREPNLVAAIAPSRFNNGDLRFRHTGVELEKRPYRHAYVPCELVVDDDALTPTSAGSAPGTDDEHDLTWTGAVGASLGRDYTDWERALLRSIARAVLGDPEPDLIRPGGGPVSLDDRGGAMLLAAIDAATHPAELLGPELLDRLRGFRIVEQLGHDQRRTIAELTATLDAAIPWIEDRPLHAVPGFHPVIADPLRARVIGKLAGRSLYEASAVLAARQRAAQRAERLASHRAWPEAALELPATTPQVPITGVHVTRGVVGVNELERLVIHVHVEGRRLTTDAVDGDLPLVARVDVPEILIDGDFKALLTAVRGEILDEVRAAGVALIEAELAREPNRLIDHGGLARLLRRLLQAGLISDDLRGRLAAAPMFPLIQGGHGAIASSLQVTTAAWTDDWIGPGDAAPHALDRLILYVPAGSDGNDIRAIIEALATKVADLTDAVTRLQTRRRVAQGLIAAPTVPGAVRALTRTLDKLGPIAERLGPGEITLVDDTVSYVLPFAGGKPGPVILVDVFPAVKIAVEAPDLASGMLSDDARTGPLGHVQRVATALVRELTRDANAAALPAWARHRIRAALLARRLDAADVGNAPIVQTTTDAWLPWKAVLDQRAQFGDVWFTGHESRALPLDPARVAFRFGRADDTWRIGPPLDLVDATDELRLDDEARRNQARSRVDALAVTADEKAGALGTRFELSDPVRRGWVVPLLPGASHLRGIRAHKDLYPFDRSDDPCAWPTLAVIEDPTLTPNRTWSKPEENAAWTALCAQIRAASLAAARAHDPPPDGCIATQFLPPGVDALGGAGCIGWLWLASPSDHPAWLEGPGAVRVRFSDREVRIEPPGARPVHGWIAVRAPYGGAVRTATEQIIVEAYTALLGQAAGATTRDDAACHVAAGVLRGAIDTAAQQARFRCFLPAPLTAAELRALWATDEAIVVVPPGAALRQGQRGIVDDGSHLSRTMLARFARRLRAPDAAPPPVPRAKRSTEPGRAVPSQFASPPPPPPRFAPPPPPPPPHPLQGLADAITLRLDMLGLAPYVNRIAFYREYMSRWVDYADGLLCIADHPRFHGIETARAAGSPFAGAAIDALVAHVVHVLNARLTPVTDATEAAALAHLLDDARS